MNRLNRRDLLKRLTLGAGAVCLPLSLTALPAAAPKESPDEFNFHGWRVEWRDWQRIPNQDVKVGFWVAYGQNTDPWHLYSAWPGACGPFVLNALLDVSLRNDQWLTTGQSSPEDLALAKSECRERLKRLIVRVGCPPLDRKRL